MKPIIRDEFMDYENEKIKIFNEMKEIGREIQEVKERSDWFALQRLKIRNIECMKKYHKISSLFKAQELKLTVL